MQYFEAIRKAGAEQIKREIDMPDFRLGIERAENLNNVPIKVAYTVARNNPVMQTAAEQSYEKVAYNGVNDGVTESMFEGGYEAGSIWAAIEAGRAN